MPKIIRLLKIKLKEPDFLHLKLNIFKKYRVLHFIEIPL